MRTWKRAALLGTSWMILACGGGGGGSAQSTAKTACEPGALVWRAPYGVENNVEANKNVSAPNTPYTGDITQCVTVAAGASGTVDASWRWDWPVLAPGMTLRAYPEVEYGQKPWMDKVAGAALPARLSELGQVVVHLDAREVARSADYQGKLGFDLWIVGNLEKQEATGGMPLVGQVQIFLEDTTGSTCARTFRNGDETWRACGATLSDAAESWPLVAYYAPPGASLARDLDLMPFLEDFRAHEGLATRDSDYFTSVEFGNQVFQGAGETSVTGFGVTVVKK